MDGNDDDDGDVGESVQVDVSDLPPPPARAAAPKGLPGFPMMPMVPGQLAGPNQAQALQQSAASLLSALPPVRNPRPFMPRAPRPTSFYPMRPTFIPALPPPPPLPQFPSTVPDEPKHDGTMTVPAKASVPVRRRDPSPERRRSRSHSRRRRKSDSRSRGRRRRRGRDSRSRSRRRRRSDSRSYDGNDQRPDIEKRKGGVKLFIGRLPQEVSDREIRDCFEEYGRVIEVFKMKDEEPGGKRHGGYNTDGFTCAFVRVSSLKMAEECIEELHEQRCLIAEKRAVGAIQVAFAKGEAARLGLPEIREMLPDRLEAKERARLQREKGILLGQASQILGSGGINVMIMRESILRNIVQYGISRDQKFKSAWTHYAQSSWGGTTEPNPEMHGHSSLAQFVAMRTFDYMNVDWFKERIDDATNKCMLGELPPSMPPASVLPVPTPPRPVHPAMTTMPDLPEIEFDYRPGPEPMDFPQQPIIMPPPIPPMEPPMPPPPAITLPPPVQEMVNYDDI